MDENPRPAKRPRRNAPRKKGVDGSRNSASRPRTGDAGNSKPGTEVHFTYTRKGEKEEKEGWEEVSWTRADAFTEFLLQFRANVAWQYEMDTGKRMNSGKFAANVEMTDTRDADGKVTVMFRVRKPRDPGEDESFLGHVRYRGNERGEGEVDIVTRGFTMQFPDVSLATGQQPRRKTIGNAKLEKAILAFMDDDKNNLHRVRLMSSDHDYHFRFDSKATDHFSARQREVDPDLRDCMEQSILDLETIAGPSSEARPWQDTLLSIGEIDPAQGRHRVYDSYGRTEGNRWARVKEQDFRDWTKRALFLFQHEFSAVDSSGKHPRQCQWFYKERAQLIHDERFAGRLYLNGLQLRRWELAAPTLNDRGLKYAYNLSPDSEDQRIEIEYTVISPEQEAKAIAGLWKTVLYDEPSNNPVCDMFACDLLHKLLKTSHRDSVNVIQHLDEEVATVLSRFLTHPDTKTASGKRLWYISESESNTLRGVELMTIKQVSGYECEVLPDVYWSLFVGKPSLLRGVEAEMRRIDQQRAAEMRRMAGDASTDQVAPVVRDSTAVPHDHPAEPDPGGARSSSSAASTRPSPGKTSWDKSTEPSTEPSVGSSEVPYRGPGASTVPPADALAHVRRIQQLEEQLKAAKKRAAASQAQRDEKMVTKTPAQTDQADAIMDDASDESDFVVPSGYFPNEVMRLVHACLALCPYPINTYTCRPIEGDTVASGFSQFDHESGALKIHREWLDMDRMLQHFEISAEDTSQTDLLCETVQELWEDVIQCETRGTRGKQHGRAAWARCRSEIRRRLQDYRHVCRVINVPEALANHGELSVVTSALALTGWSKENDNVHLSLHCEACSWLRRCYNTWKSK